MKHKLLAALTIFLVLSMTSAKAQWFDFANNEERLTIGFNIGAAGYGTDYQDVGFGTSLSFYGVYIDFLLSGPDHKYDNHVNNTLWQDDVAWSINVGYQIPILRWLRIAPIIGYSQENYGVTDASTVNIEVSENSGSMYHDYYPMERFHSFNYGGALYVQLGRYVELYGVGTRHAVYGGIALNITNVAK